MTTNHVDDSDGPKGGTLRAFLNHSFHRCPTATQDFQDFLRVRLALANEYKATKTHAEKQETKRNTGKQVGTDQTEVQDICREFPKTWS